MIDANSVILSKRTTTDAAVLLLLPKIKIGHDKMNVKDVYVYAIRYGAGRPYNIEWTRRGSDRARLLKNSIRNRIPDIHQPLWWWR